MAIISKESRKPIKKGRGEHTCGFSIHTNGLRSYSPSPNHVHLSFHYTGKIPKQANLSTRSIRLPPTRLHRILLPHPRTEPPPWSNKYSISSNLVRPPPPFVRSNIIDRTARSTRVEDRLRWGALAGISNRSGRESAHTLRRKNQLTQKLENFVSSSIRSLTFCSPSFHAKSLRSSPWLCTRAGEGEFIIIIIFFFWKEEKKGCNEY